MNRKFHILMLVPVLAALAVSCVYIQTDTADSFRSAFKISYDWRYAGKANTPDSMTVFLAHAEFGGRDTVMCYKNAEGGFDMSRDTTLVSGRYYSMAFGSVEPDYSVPLMSDVLSGGTRVSALKLNAPAVTDDADIAAYRRIASEMKLPEGMKLDFNPSIKHIVNPVARIFWGSGEAVLSPDEQAEIQFVPKDITMLFTVKMMFDAKVKADTVVACLAGVPSFAYALTGDVDKSALAKIYFPLARQKDDSFSGSVRTLGLFAPVNSNELDFGPGILYVSVCSEDKVCSHYARNLKDMGWMRRAGFSSDRFTVAKASYTYDAGTLRPKDMVIDFNQGGELGADDSYASPED